MKISIVTPWTDHEELLPDYRAAVKGADEVLVIDNASDARTAYLLQQASDEEGWRYVRNDVNRYFAPAVNQGFALASGDVLITINSDVAGAAAPFNAWLQGVRRDVKPGGMYGPALRSGQCFGTEYQYLEGWCMAAYHETWGAIGYFDDVAFPYPYSEDPAAALACERAGIPLIETSWPLLHKGSRTSATVKGACDYQLINESVFTRRMWFHHLQKATSPTPPTS